MHAAYVMSTPVVYTSFIEVLLLIFGFFNLIYILSVCVESLCLFIYMCCVIFVIIRL